MTNAPIRIVAILGAITMVSIVTVQVYWANQAIDSMEQQFSHNVRMSLQNVVESVCQLNGTDVPVRNPIEQVSSAYFIVRTNQPIQLRSLENVLVTEFENREIREPFEYGVYDCQNEQMVFSNMVSPQLQVDNAIKSYPALESYDYYFGVYFPSMAGLQWLGPDWLKLTTFLTLLIFLFFVYVLFVLLRQKRLSATQRDFINNIMHEFKTPLSTLKIAGEVLEDPKISSQPQRLARYGALVAQETARLENQITSLLKNTTSAQKEQVELIRVDVSRVINDVEQRILPLLKGKKLVISGNINQSVKASYELLEVSIFNILENAIKYGGNHISLNVSETSSEVIIVIHDNGKGIPINEAKHIFDRFYRISQGNQHDVKGFGLGLYVVKQSIRKMYGRVKLIAPEKAMFQIRLKKDGKR